MMVAPPAAVLWIVILTLLALGMGRGVMDRRWAVGKENAWSFGQVPPMLIVVLPYFTVTEELQCMTPSTEQIAKVKGRTAAKTIIRTTDYRFAREDWEVYVADKLELEERCSLTQNTLNDDSQEPEPLMGTF
jgi:hypothetical protein